MTDNALITCLWFNTEAEQAATFYTGVFKDSRLGRVHRHTEAGPGPEGSVLLVEFEAERAEVLRPERRSAVHLQRGVSVVVPCADQTEVDYYWSHLSEGGQEIACGWLKRQVRAVLADRPGQVLRDRSSTRTAQKAARVTRAMLGMTKFDIAALERAYVGA